MVDCPHESVRVLLLAKNVYETINQNRLSPEILHAGLSLDGSISPPSVPFKPAGRV